MILFNSPYVSLDARKFLLEATNSGHYHGDGPYSKLASDLVSDLVGGGRVLLTTSCTHSLEMASILVDLKPGDEVIMPSYNFTSGGTAVTKFGGVPIFCDIDSKTGCLDAERVRDLITERTRAISWVNYAGFAPNVELLREIADSFQLVLIEDNAHGLGGTHKGQPLGSFGDIATQSFHSTKNIHCGEGGAIILNNENYLERAEIIREKGTNRKDFTRGKVDKYEWIDQGSSYLLSDLLAAFLYGQLLDFKQVQESRRLVSRQYSEILPTVLSRFDLPLPQNYIEGESSFHLYFLMMNDENSRDKIILEMKTMGVEVTSHYQPLHASPFGRRFSSNRHLSLENSHTFARTILRLPIHCNIKEQDLNFVVHSLEQSLEKL